MRQPRRVVNITLDIIANMGKCKTWLSSKKERVKLNGKKSSWVRVTSWVPQVLVLDLLLLMYINDLVSGQL